MFVILFKMLGEIKNKHSEIIDYTFHLGSEKSRHLLIVGHGVMGDKDNPLVSTLAREVANQGMSTLCFSFTGNGYSEGRFADCTISKEIEDLQYILSSAVEQGWRPIYAGHNMGAAVGVLSAAIDSRIEFLISLAGMVETQEFCRKEFQQVKQNNRSMWGDPAFPLSDSFVKDMHEIKSILPRATGINIPWLLLHGTKDDVVPPIESQSLITNFRSTRDLVKIEGADHAFSGEYTNQLIEAVVEWLAKKI